MKIGASKTNPIEKIYILDKNLQWLILEHGMF